jgi:non-heme chloroperoxidase
LAVPGSSTPLLQAATANLNPLTEAKVDTKNPDRGHLLIVSGEKDDTVPWSIANASYKRQEHTNGVTEVVEIPGRGHALVIDGGWREVADTAHGFVGRFVEPESARWWALLRGCPLAAEDLTCS